jgi:hypothetical protein
MTTAKRFEDLDDRQKSKDLKNQKMEPQPNTRRKREDGASTDD